MKSSTTRQMPPFNRHLGFEIREWRQGHIVLAADVRPEHHNYSGIPHGGFIATLLDAAMAMPGVYSGDPDWVRCALTLSMTINFLGQATGDRLKAVGRVTASGSRIYYSAAEVYDMTEKPVASGQGVFRYRSGSEPRQKRG